MYNGFYIKPIKNKLIVVDKKMCLTAFLTTARLFSILFPEEMDSTDFILVRSLFLGIEPSRKIKKMLLKF